MYVLDSGPSHEDEQRNNDGDHGFYIRKSSERKTGMYCIEVPGAGREGRSS